MKSSHYGSQDVTEGLVAVVAGDAALMRPYRRPDWEAPDLLELLQLDEAGFKARFAGTPMLRTKRRGLLRNVCVALGNLGDPRALAHLERASTDPEPLIAEHARWAIEQIRNRQGPRSDMDCDGSTSLSL